MIIDTAASRRTLRVARVMSATKLTAILALAACVAPDDPPVEHAEAVAQAETVKDLVLASAPAATLSGPGRIEVFAQDTSNVLWWRTYEDGDFGDWRRIDSDGTTTLVATSKPAVVSRAPGAVDVFVRGADSALWHRSLRNGVFSPWRSLGGALLEAPGVASDAPGHLDVFAQGLDRTLYRLRYRVEDFRPGICRIRLGCIGGQDGWSSWEGLGGVITSSPAAAAMERGRIDVVARGPANDLVHRFTTDGGATWSAFTSAGGVISSSPTVSARSPALHVFATAVGPSLWTQSYNRFWGWNGWNSVAVDGEPDMPSFNEPAVVTQADGCDQLFGRARDGSLWHRGCGEKNVVRVTNASNGASDVYVLGNHATLALNDAMLPSTAGASSATFELSDARWPRELFVLDTDARVPPPDATAWTGQSGLPVLPSPWGGPGFGPWVAGGKDVMFASIPGITPTSSGFEPYSGPFFTRLSVPWAPRAARLVDHGGCARKIPYTKSVYTSPDPEGVGTIGGLFSDIETGISKGLHVAAAKAGGDYAIRELKIEPAFLTPAGSSDPAAVADGISIAVRAEIWKTDSLTGITGSLSWSAFVTYRAEVRDGMIALTPVTPTAVWLSTNTAYDVARAIGSVLNFFAGVGEGFASTFGADDPSYQTTLPPAPGDMRGVVAQTFDTLLPAMVRTQALAASRARQPDRSLQAVGLCDPGLSETDAGRGACWDQRTTFLREAVKQRLVASGVAAATADARASTLAAGVPRETYDCVAPKEGGSGRCLWHPAARRVNVMPDRLEIVWYDETPSADAEVVRIVAPSAAAAMCSDMSGEKTARGPMRISKLDTTVRLH